MFYTGFSFESLCGNFIRTVTSTIQACVTAFNLLDPFRFVRASRKLQQSFLQVLSA